MVTDVEHIQWKRRLGLISQDELLTVDQKKEILPLEYQELLEANNGGKVHPWVEPFFELSERQIIADKIEQLFGVLKWKFTDRTDQSTGATINIVEKELLPLLNELLLRGTPPKECGICE